MPGPVNIRAVLGIVGSRCLEGEVAAERAVLQVITEWQLTTRDGLEIVTGDARGVDRMAVQIATHLGISVRVIAPDMEALRATPRVGSWPIYRERNRRIVQACTHLVRVGCPGSTTRGSWWTEQAAARQRRRVLPAIEVVCAAHAGAVA